VSQVPAGAGPDSPTRPLLAVGRGEPTAVELAALTAVISALVRRARERPPVRQAPSQWAARDRIQRPSLASGPGAWRASGLPH